MLVFRIIATLFLSLIVFPCPSIAKDRAWTILVYVAADNDLDPYAELDFTEMAQVGSTDEVAIVAQIDRQEGPAARYLVKKNDAPYSDPLADLGEVNMGDPKSLQDFIVWGAKSYPSQNLALIIWNHGSGWRNATTNRVLGGGFKHVASDDTDNDALYNSEVVQAVTDAQKATGKKLHLIGFDACLMSTLEIWYGLRNVADFGVGSQDLEPGTGWFYDKFLESLVKNPQTDSRNLAISIVLSYADGFKALEDDTGVKETYTLAAIDLTKMKEAEGAFSGASKLMGNDLAATTEGRKDLKTFNDGKTNWPHLVDAVTLLERTSAASKEIGVKEQIAKTIDVLHSSILKSVFSEDRADHRSEGISIYMPATMQEFQEDPFSSGYVKGNKEYPVDFVSDSSWPITLASYLKKKQ